MNLINRIQLLVALLAPIFSLSCPEVRAEERLAVSRLIKPGSQITWKNDGYDRATVHELLIVQQSGTTFEGYFRGPYLEYEETALPSYSRVSGYVSGDYFVCTVSEKRWANGKVIDSPRKFACHENADLQLKDLQVKHLTIRGTPHVKIVQPSELKSRIENAERVFATGSDKLKAAQLAVDAMCQLGEAIEIENSGAILEDGRFSVKWTLRDEEYTEAQREAIKRHVRTLQSVHEVVVGRGQSDSHFELLKSIPHIDLLRIKAYRGDGLGKLLTAKVDSLRLELLYWEVSIEKVFNDANRITSLRALALQRIYYEIDRNTPRMQPVAITNEKLKRLELSGKWETSNELELDKCKQLECLIYPGQLTPQSAKSLSNLNSLQKLTCAFENEIVFESLQSRSLSSLYACQFERDTPILSMLEKSNLPSLEYLHLQNPQAGGDLEFFLRLKSKSISAEEMDCHKEMERMRCSDEFKPAWGLERYRKFGNVDQPISGLNVYRSQANLARGRPNSPSASSKSIRDLQGCCDRLFHEGVISKQVFKDFFRFTYPFTLVWCDESHKAFFNFEELRALDEAARAQRN